MSNYYSFVFHVFKFKYELENIFKTRVNTYEFKTNKNSVPNWYKFIVASLSDIKQEQIYKIAIGSLYATMLSFLVIKILG